MKSWIKKAFSNPFIVIIIFTAGVLTLLPFIFDGVMGCNSQHQCGFIVGTNYRDGMWYQAVASTAFQTFPFRMPNFSGEPLQGYHYLPNLISFLLSRVGIPISVSFYQIFPVMYFVGLTFLSVVFSHCLSKKQSFIPFYLFFVFFGMPLTFITSLYHSGYINNYTLINTFQATRIPESIHTGFSLLIFLSVMIFSLRKKWSWNIVLYMPVALFIAWGTKVYVAVGITIYIFIFELFRVIQKRSFGKETISFILSLIAVVGAVFIFYNPLHAGKTFVFSPFATVHHLIETPTLFPFHNMVLARYFLYSHGWSPRLYAIELFSTGLFILFYYGTRCMGFIYILKQILSKKITRFEISLSIVIVILTACSVLYIQKGDWFNPIQFAVVASFLLSIFSAKCIWELYQRSRLVGGGVFAVIFVLTFIPHLVHLSYLSHPARYVIPQKEVEALVFLRSQPDGVVLSPIFDPDLAYVSAFTNKQTFVNFSNVLENNDIQFQNRLKVIAQFEEGFVSSLPVSYVYIPRSYARALLLKKACILSKKFEKVFENSEVVIFRKNRLGSSF